MRSRLVPLLAASITLLGACGGEDATDDDPGRTGRGSGGKAGRAGAAGASSAGAAGATNAGSAGAANAGAAGSTSAGAAGSTTAGFGGTTSAGFGGTTSAGFGGTTSAGFGGTTAAGAAGNTSAGSAGTTSGGAGGGAAGSTAAGAAGSTAAGAAGTGGGSAGSGPADCTGTLPAGDRQLQGSVFMTNQTHSIDMTQFINIGESSAPGAAKNGYPGRTGNTWVPFVQREKFVAFAFQADLARGESQSFTIAETTVVTSAIFSLSISECPGDFRPSLSATCRFTGGQGGIISARHPTENYPGVCMLRPGRTYYFNMIHRDATGASTCPEGAFECGNLFVTYTD